MSTPSPAVADALALLLALLGDDLYLHLDEAESLATQLDVWSDDDMEVARDVIGDLVRLIRGLLMEHERQPSGDCQICTAAWPCPVVTTIHALVKDPQGQFVELVRWLREQG